MIDPRTADLFMVDSPLPSALICLGYLVVVYMGPSLMANRPAFKIKELLIIYNFAMVALSGYLFYEVNHLKPINSSHLKFFFSFSLLVGSMVIH